LNGELFVWSSVGAVEVLLCVPLELVLSAATLVVTVVLLETLVSLAADPEVDAVDEVLWVVVMVLPAEFVVVKSCPAAIVV